MSITGEIYAEQGARILALEAELRAEREKNATAIESLLASVAHLGNASRSIILDTKTREAFVGNAIALVLDTADHYFTGRTMDAATLPPGWEDSDDGPQRIGR